MGTFSSLNSAQERFRQLLEYLGTSPKSFADAYGLSYNQVKCLSCGRLKKVPTEIAEVCSIHFPSISQPWLLYGNGDMLITEDATPEPKEPTQEEVMMTAISQLTTTVNTMLKSMEAQNRRIDQLMQLLVARNGYTDYRTQYVAEPQAYNQETITGASKFIHDPADGTTPSAPTVSPPDSPSET